jgi:hypothetical protein
MAALNVSQCDRLAERRERVTRGHELMGRVAFEYCARDSFADNDDITLAALHSLSQGLGLS